MGSTKAGKEACLGVPLNMVLCDGRRWRGRNGGGGEEAGVASEDECEASSWEAKEALQISISKEISEEREES